MIGIYKITSPTKKIYIGQTNNYKRRLVEYKRLHCKAQRKVYNSLNKYGFKKHTFEMIHLCDESELNDLERYYQDLYQCIGSKGLNLKLAHSKTRSGKLSQYVKDKISKSNMGKIVSAESRMKMSIAKKGKPTHTSYTKMSDETKRRISISKKGTPAWNKGIERTNKEKKKISINRIGKCKGSENHGSKLIINIQTGIYYFGIREAAESYDNNYHSMRDRLSGKTNNRTSFVCLK